MLCPMQPVIYNMCICQLADVEGDFVECGVWKGGSYIDVCFVRATYCKATEQQFQYGSEAPLIRVQQAFHRCHDDCIRAVDGSIIKLRAPISDKVVFAKHYRSKKIGFGVLVLAGCNAMCVSRVNAKMH